MASGRQTIGDGNVWWDLTPYKYTYVLGIIADK